MEYVHLSFACSLSTNQTPKSYTPVTTGYRRFHCYMKTMELRVAPVFCYQPIHCQIDSMYVHDQVQENSSNYSIISALMISDISFSLQ